MNVPDTHKALIASILHNKHIPCRASCRSHVRWVWLWTAHVDAPNAPPYDRSNLTGATMQRSRCCCHRNAPNPVRTLRVCAGGKADTYLLSNTIVCLPHRMSRRRHRDRNDAHIITVCLRISIEYKFAAPSPQTSAHQHYYTMLTHFCAMRHAGLPNTDAGRNVANANSRVPGICGYVWVCVPGCVRQHTADRIQ